MRRQFTLFLLVLALHVGAADFYSRRITSDNGLPDNNVRSLALDKQGFLWLGTPNGLYRYDGYFFTLFRHDDKDNALLYSNHINALRSLSSGLVLVRQQGDLYSLYDVTNGCWLDMTIVGKRPQFRYFAEVDSTLWLWEERGAAVAYRYRDGELTYELFHSGDVPHPEYSTAGYEVAKRLVEREGWDTMIFDNVGNPCVLDKHGRLVWINKDSKRQVYLDVFDPRLIPLVESRKYVVCTSPDGRYTWVSTNGSGITVYDHEEQATHRIDSRSGLIATDFLIGMTMDGEGNVFVCDDAHGIEAIAAPSTDIEHLLIQHNAPSFRTNRVVTLCPFGDQLLVCNSMGNVMVLDTATMELQPYEPMNGRDVHTALKMTDGREWVGTRQLGLHSRDGEVCMHSPGDPASLSSNNVIDLLEDRKGRLWVANYRAALDLKTDSGFLHFFSESNGFRVLIEDTRGRIWAGGANGLYLFYPDELLADSSAYKHVLTKEQVKYSDISDLLEDAEGRIHVSTLGDGVYVFSGDTIVGHYDASTGLISDYVHSIIVDPQRVVWMATQRGITCYDPSDNRIRHIYDNYNLLRNVYSDNAAYLLPDGRLLFGTDEGISVYQSGCPVTSRLLQPHLTDILVNNTSITQLEEVGRPAYDLENLTLPHNGNTLTFRFSAFNYHAAMGALYSYKLDGLDKDWSDVQPYSFALYRNLSPGDYVFRVRAYNNNVSEESSVLVTIRRPWWTTWWAILLYILFAAGLAYVISKQIKRFEDLRGRLKMEKELSEYKMLFFTNISHEFRTPLTIIRSAIDRIAALRDIPNDMLQPIASMQVSTERMLRLVSDLLSYRMAQRGTLRLHLEDTEVVGFLREIYLNFYLWAERKQITIDFKTTHRTFTMPVDRKILEMVAYNLVSNAIKYTPKEGHVTLRVAIEDDLLHLRVEDDGIGLSAERQAHVFDDYMHTSFSSANSAGIGLNFARAAVELHHGTISYTPAQPSGSVFEVTLPATADAYDAGEFLSAEQKELNATIASPEPETNLSRIVNMNESMPLNDRYVLVVDDEEEMRTYIASLLGHYFHVETAESGVEALRKVEEHMPDLIVSDVVMPVLDGYELVSRLRKNEATRSVPVILLSALANDDKQVRAMRLGADAYITKPFDTKLLIVTCQSLLQRHDQLRQSYAGEVVERQEVLPEIVVEERDHEFLRQLENLVKANIANENLSADFLSEKMAVGRTLFFKRVKTLTGLTPAEYIRTIRLRRAAELLAEDNCTVAEVSYQVGFDDPHYFIKLFKQQYKITPKKYQKGQKE